MVTLFRNAYKSTYGVSDCIYIWWGSDTIITIYEHALVLILMVLVCLPLACVDLVICIQQDNDGTWRLITSQTYWSPKTVYRENWEAAQITYRLTLLRLISTLCDSPDGFQGPCYNTLRPRQNGRHFPNDIFKWIFLNENVWILFKIS